MENLGVNKIGLINIAKKYKKENSVKRTDILNGIIDYQNHHDFRTIRESIELFFIENGIEYEFNWNE